MPNLAKLEQFGLSASFSCPPLLESMETVQQTLISAAVDLVGAFFSSMEKRELLKTQGRERGNFDWVTFVLHQ